MTRLVLLSFCSATIGVTMFTKGSTVVLIATVLLATLVGLGVGHGSYRVANSEVKLDFFNRDGQVGYDVVRGKVYPHSTGSKFESVP